MYQKPCSAHMRTRMGEIERQREIERHNEIERQREIERRGLYSFSYLSIRSRTCLRVALQHSLSVRVRRHGGAGDVFPALALHRSKTQAGPERLCLSKSA
jgi:hypothetical protein